MKLATALSTRADLQTRINQLAVRLNNNAKVQEGEAPAEDPVRLLKELDACIIEYEDLVGRINMTNSSLTVDGKTMTRLLAERDAKQKKLSILRGFLDCASERVNRYSKTEIVIKSTVDVAALQKDVDALSKELRQLDEVIQSTNWIADLI